MRWVLRTGGTSGFARIRGGDTFHSVDQPSPAVMAHGMDGVAPHQCFLDSGGGDVPGAVVETVKPSYLVPSMAEVAAIPRNGLRVISTFSGCGGSCLGFEMAGYEILAACEFVGAARDVYAANHPGVPVEPRDIRDVRPEDLMALAGVGVGEVDVLEGSPPCASFSTAGKRQAHWGQVSKYSDTSQRTDDLFFEFARLLDGIRPRAFVAENVSGLVKGSAKGYFKEILARLRACGYVVEARVLDAQWLGVPQTRQRLIFVGVRDDLGLTPRFPAPLPYRYSIRDALPWLDGSVQSMSNGRWGTKGHGEPTPTDVAPSPTVMAGGDVGGGAYEVRVVHDTSGQYGKGEVTDLPSPTVTVGVNSVNSHHYQVHGGAPLTQDPETGYRISLDQTAIGPEYDKLAEGEQSDRYFNLVRADGDEPTPTVTASGGGRGTAAVTHPTQRRKFTLLELRRLCSFPDDFVLTGTYQQRWERLGRAVPPLMMRAVAASLAEVLLGG